MFDAYDSTTLPKQRSSLKVNTLNVALISQDSFRKYLSFVRQLQKQLLAFTFSDNSCIVYLPFFKAEEFFRQRIDSSMSKYQQLAKSLLLEKQILSDKEMASVKYLKILDCN